MTHSGAIRPGPNRIRDHRCTSAPPRRSRAAMKIVVGYVKSPEGAAAVDRAIEEARLRNASLVIVHSSKGGLREDVDEAVAYQEQLDEIDRRLAGQGVTHEVRQLTRGKDPDDDCAVLCVKASSNR